MPVRGNPKGSNGGGGRIKGQRFGETKAQALARMRGDVAEAVATQVQAGARADVPRQKLGKDILEDAANYFFGLAAKYQPSEGNPDADEKKFEKYLDKASDIAAKLAPYQSPRLSSVQVTEIPMDLSRLSNEELEQLERLHAKAAHTGGNPSGEAPQVH